MKKIKIKDHISVIVVGLYLTIIVITNIIMNLMADDVKKTTSIEYQLDHPREYTTGLVTYILISTETDGVSGLEYYPFIEILDLPYEKDGKFEGFCLQSNPDKCYTVKEYAKKIECDLVHVRIFEDTSETVQDLRKNPLIRIEKTYWLGCKNPKVKQK